MHSHLGVLGVTGFLMKNLAANPLDYTEGGALNQRRQELSAILDCDQPGPVGVRQARRQDDRHDRHQRHAGVTGRAARLLPVRARQDGTATVDRFARLFVMPQTGHGLSGTSYTMDGDGKTFAAAPIPNRYDQIGVAVRLGREQRRAGNVGHRDRGREEPAAVFVSDVSPIQGWCACYGELYECTVAPAGLNR